MSTAMVSATAIGKKLRVLRNSRPYYQDRWHTGKVGSLWCPSSGRRRSFASLIELTLAAYRPVKRDELTATDLRMRSLLFLRCDGNLQLRQCARDKQNMPIIRDAKIALKNVNP